MLASACGGSSSPTAPSIAQVGGAWTGLVTQTSVSGGECVGVLFQSSNGASDRFTASITQDGSSLTASASSQTAGHSCVYTGTAGSSSVSLNATFCQPSSVRLQCANGALRDIYLVGGMGETGSPGVSRRITGTVSGNTLSGTIGETWNVFVSGASTNSLGVLVVNNSFTLSR